MGLEVKIDAGGFDRLGRAVRRKLAQALQEEAETFRDRAKQLSPVDTGALRDSLEAVQLNEDEWEVHDGVPYGIHQNYGFRHHQSGQHVPGSGFFSQAQAESEARWPQAMAAAVREAVREAGR